MTPTDPFIVVSRLFAIKKIVIEKLKLNNTKQ
jgi:hypothetical protein